MAILAKKETEKGGIRDKLRAIYTVSKGWAPSNNLMLSPFSTYHITIENTRELGSALTVFPTEIPDKMNH